MALLASPENLARLKRAIEELEAELIAVPKLDIEFLRKGHAIHFRCHHPEADGMRLDPQVRGVKIYRDCSQSNAQVILDFM